MRYRTDIDGLRAVAVLPVVAYHAGLGGLPGGFVGVDVFFVISGYLITSNIAAEIKGGSFSILGFYERRIRRIAPALCSMLIAATVVAYMVLLPFEYIDYSRSLAASILSFSNIYFWTQFNYFDAGALSKPLLHTWSLSVEEQFYLVFPLLLSFLHKKAPSRVGLVIVAIALVSLILSTVGVFTDKVATFYLPHTRAWELLLGSMVALKITPALSGPVIRNVAAAVGLALIGGAVLLFRESMLFPGPAALIPCVGAALILSAGEGGTTLAGRLLSWRPVVFVGLVSYSLYLWHWPVIVFTQMNAHLLQGAPAPVIKISMIAVSFVLAVISWRYVERPFREGPLRLPRPSLFKFAAVVATALVGLGMLGQFDRGLEYRYSPQARKIGEMLAQTDHKGFREGDCFIASAYKVEDFKDYCLSEKPSNPDYLLIGDSHAAHLWWGLHTALPTVNVMQATASGCKPTIDQASSAERRCVDLMDRIFKQYLQDHQVDTLVIAARWQASDLPRLSKTLDWATGKGIQVVLVGPIPEYRSRLPRLLAIADRFHDPDLVARQRIDVSKLDRSLATLAGRRHVKYISLLKTMCPGGTCVEVDSLGEPVQFDYGHLTERGSQLVVERLVSTGQLP
ncbi:putative acyltransferase [Caulobacter sp. AP07]|uniref:acyltransferase family protein n=1 Tax=Caulobacter sp. AP07 TaxID=1144304 RepID=UPI000271F2B1|nr:acyltransferase family protein [Caulobacter sp. AP07]EJL30667.1 putative acyltransferase [Caulobacter sp. AP07]